jgi:hypothetical protein
MLIVSHPPSPSMAPGSRSPGGRPKRPSQHSSPILQSHSTSYDSALSRSYGDRTNSASSSSQNIPASILTHSTQNLTDEGRSIVTSIESHSPIFNKASTSSLLGTTSEPIEIPGPPKLSPQTPAKRSEKSRSKANAPESESSETVPNKKIKPMDPAGIVMPLRYENCNVRDLVVVISNMLMELIRLNDSIPLQDGQLTRFHSRYVFPSEFPTTVLIQEGHRLEYQYSTTFKELQRMLHYRRLFSLLWSFILIDYAHYIRHSRSHR